VAHGHEHIAPSLAYLRVGMRDHLGKFRQCILQSYNDISGLTNVFQCCLRITDRTVEGSGDALESSFPGSRPARFQMPSVPHTRVRMHEHNHQREQTLSSHTSTHANLQALSRSYVCSRAFTQACSDWGEEGGRRGGGSWWCGLIAASNSYYKIHETSHQHFIMMKKVTAV